MCFLWQVHRRASTTHLVLLPVLNYFGPVGGWGSVLVPPSLSGVSSALPGVSKETILTESYDS